MDMNPLRVIRLFIILCGKDVGKICVAVVSDCTKYVCVCVCVWCERESLKANS